MSQTDNPYTGDAEKDQEIFDLAVNKDGKIILFVLAAILILASFVMSLVALTNSSEKTIITAPAMVMTTPTASVPAPVLKVHRTGPTIALSVSPGWKLGPDGQKHDAFTKTDFSVKVGKPLNLKITNTDSVPHSITDTAIGVNIIAAPGTHVYTLLVKSAGKFEWYCVYPCDPWSMVHAGYMAGYITAT